MNALDAHWRSLDAAFWELGEAMTGMPDEDLWVRAHPKLLSVGELCAHIAYGEAGSFLDGLDGPLAAMQPDYYPHMLGRDTKPLLTTSELMAELERVHKACRAAFESESPAPEAINARRGDWTWEYTLIYMAFHTAYHAGQIYSVRHMLGHETVDN